MSGTTRREALVTIAAGFATRRLAAQGTYEPSTLSREDYELLGSLVEMIIPKSETPGAREVGVHAILDEDLAKDGEALGILRNGMAALREDGFPELASQQQIDILTRYSEATGEEKTFFETLKGLTIDAYYSTEVGLVQELGYQGNTYLAEFPGCTDEHELEDAD